MTDLDAIKREIDQHRSDIARLYSLINSLSEVLKSHDDRMEGVSRRIRDVSERVKLVEGRLQRPATYYGPSPKSDEQWCRCGRDVCRYPACSSKIASIDDPDPLGR